MGGVIFVATIIIVIVLVIIFVRKSQNKKGYSVKGENPNTAGSEGIL